MSLFPKEPSGRKPRLPPSDEILEDSRAPMDRANRQALWEKVCLARASNYASGAGRPEMFRLDCETIMAAIEAGPPPKEPK